MNIVGLGAAGCNIADTFAKYPQYTSYKIDVGLKGYKKNGIYAIPRKATHEEYEENCPNFKNFFKNITGRVILATCGAGTVTGCVLRLLEQLPDVPVSILYVKPDISLLGEIKATQEKIVYNILQEYARSGLVDRMYVISNLEVEKVLVDIPISGYYDTLNEAIVSTFHMLNVFSNSEPVVGAFTEPVDSARVSTIGIVDLEKEEEKLFFDLTTPRDRVYYYGINSESLKTDGKLFKKITNFVKSRNEENVKVSYGVFETNYEQNLAYCVNHSSLIQT